MKKSFYKTTIDNSPLGYAYHKIICDKNKTPVDYIFLEINDRFKELTGLKGEEITGKKVTEVIPDIKKDRFDWIKEYGAVALSGITKEFEQFFEALQRCYHVKVFSPKKYYFVTYFSDITNEVQKLISSQHKKLIEEKELMTTTLKSIGEGVIVTDNKGIIVIANNAMENICGWSQSYLTGKKFCDAFELTDNHSKEKQLGPVDIVLNTGNAIKITNHCILTCNNNVKKPVEYNASPIKDNSGKLLGVVLVMRDVTEERKRREKIAYLGYHDSLTGLYNRRFFDEELKRLDKERNLPISIIIGDVNGLKLTNDAFGHNAGDRLLKKMAETIKKACRADDIIARWGGDEFIILLPKTDIETAKKICDRIKNIASKVKIDTIDFSISVGYETKDNKDENIQNIIKNAEDYMYRKKFVESQSMRSNTINTILLTLHEKNPRERMHSNRVCEICKIIAAEMGLTEEQIHDIGILALMHDIGKIAIDGSILNKNGRLNEKEWVEIKRHPEIGFRILSASNEMLGISKCILTHHEYYNGSGYPNGLSGENIPLLSRILTVADAYDAMTSERTYRKTISKEEAIKELMDKSSTQFDPAVVEVFIKSAVNI